MPNPTNPNHTHAHRGFLKRVGVGWLGTKRKMEKILERSLLCPVYYHYYSYAYCLLVIIIIGGGGGLDLLFVLVLLTRDPISFLFTSQTLITANNKHATPIHSLFSALFPSSYPPNKTNPPFYLLYVVLFFILLHYISFLRLLFRLSVLLRYTRFKSSCKIYSRT